MSSQAKKSIMQGTMTLAVVGLICKIIGVFFRIPLSKLLGDGGLGVYELVYPTYSLLLTVSSAGIPVAVSRMVSHSVNRNDPRNARRIFQVALAALFILGLMAMVVMIFMRGAFSAWVNESETTLGFAMIAPSVLIVCVMSAFRGFLQGQQDMKPTAMSQLIEQVGKVAISLPLAALGMRLGDRLSLPPYAAGATLALLGISISEGLALFYMYIQYHKNKKVFNQIEQNPLEKPLSIKVIAWRLLVVALPITIGACIVPLSSFVDSGMIKGLLMKAGFAADYAKETYGRYAGIVITYINVPTALAIAVTMATVPAISAGVSRRDYGYVREQAHLSLRYGFIVGFPCSIGMSVMAEPLIRIFYNNQNVPQTASMLSISAMTIVFFTVVQATSSILQGLRKQRIPMYTLLVGVGAKIILNQLIVPIPKINIYGASISSLACYIISMVPNLYYVMKFTKMKFDWGAFIIKPLAASIMMGMSVWAAMKVLPMRLISTFVLVIIGVVAYVAFSLLIKSFTKEDLAFLKRPARRMRR